jgi:hypothetical protein
MRNQPKQILRAAVLGAAAALPSLPAVGQGTQPNDPLTQPGYIKGTMVAQFKTQRPENRDGDYPMKGVADTFQIDLAVGYTKYQGMLSCLPHVFSKHIGRVLQEGSCTYDVNLSVVNPQNAAQVRSIGKLAGSYAIDEKGMVNLNAGNVRMEVQTIGKAQGFSSPFAGVFAGRPPAKVTTLSKAIDQAAKEVRTIEKMVGQRKVTVALGNVDPVRFQGTQLAMGPVSSYPQATVDGELLYSYETDNWFPQLTIRSGNAKPDKLSGGMKWVDDKPAEGHYELNVLVNEQAPAQGEAAAFEAAQGEDAFFQSDTSQSVINGRISFKDQKIGEAVVKSDIAFDVGLQNVSAVQAQNFAKLLLLIPVQMWGE